MKTSSFEALFPDAFFPGISEELSGLFVSGEPVWSALDRLSAFMDSTDCVFAGTDIKAGVPLSRTLFFMPDGKIRDDLQTECGPDTKGRVMASKRGRIMPEVTVFCAGAVFAGKGVWAGRGVTVESGAFIKGPAVLGDGTEVRQGAYLRGDVLSGRNCVIGHTTEIKHSILLDGAKAGHFAYIGDSILGRNVNLGAGTKMANLRFASGNVIMQVENRRIDTDRRKFGAILGDNVQTGCNSVTNPGTVVGAGSVIVPNATVMPGCYPAGAIIR